MFNFRTLSLLLIFSTLLSCSKDKTCPTGFQGDNCDEEITPSSVFIKSITLTRYPKTTSNGAGWDLDSGPDLYYVIVDKTTGAIVEKNTYVSNAATTPIIFNDVDFSATPFKRYSINFFDYDLGRTNIIDADDQLGGIEFSPYIPGEKFPKSTLLDVGGSVAFALVYEYRF